MRVWDEIDITKWKLQLPPGTWPVVDKHVMIDAVCWEP